MLVGHDSERVSGVIPTQRMIELRHDEFGWTGLEGVANRRGESIEDVIDDACEYFVLELDEQRMATRLPRFRDPAGTGATRSLRLQLPERVWQALEAQAQDQRAELARVIEHAALLYMADLESGRAARRILEAEGFEG